MAKKIISTVGRFHVKVNIETCHDRGYLRIPFELLSLKIPQEKGEERFITLSEVHVLAFLMQFSEGNFTFKEAAQRLSLNPITVSKSIRTLTEAGYLDIACAN